MSVVVFWPMLITVETGVGKEFFARTYYLLGSRRGKPFVIVNCPQYQQADLSASELFGHKQGSFNSRKQCPVALKRRGPFPSPARLDSPIPCSQRDKTPRLRKASRPMNAFTIRNSLFRITSGSGRRSP